MTDEHGEIRISGIVGTVVVTEIKSGPGYQLDEANRTQTVTINPGDTQTIQFYNAPISKVEFIKVDEANRSVRIPDTTIEVRRLDGALVTTLVTSESGQAFAQLEDGSYYAVETVANPKYQLDSTPVYFEVKDGKCAPVVLTNKMICGILIHKTSTRLMRASTECRLSSTTAIIIPSRRKRAITKDMSVLRASPQAVFI